MLDRIHTVRVDRIARQTDDIAAFELVPAFGAALPAYEAGAHIDVHLPGGFMRPYSLARAPDAAHSTRYVIGVKREAPSRGGSASLHERVRVGDLLAIGGPRNNFALQRAAREHLLLAGGIGLTPLLAMAQQLQREGARFTLCVFARSRAHLPFAGELAALAPHVRLHFDDAGAPDKLDLATLLMEPAAGAHLYLCGPAGFMAAVQAAATAWPEDQVHLEYFAAPDAGADAALDEPFVLTLARRGIDVNVAADQTAIDALHDIGVDVPTSCEQGVCGTCVVGLMTGEVEHRDHCLSATERLAKVALCCSRARAGRLVIDL
jgi:ferredoxin-NADP reductase